jgi:hypothetical protein
VFIEVTSWGVAVSKSKVTVNGGDVVGIGVGVGVTLGVGVGVTLGVGTGVGVIVITEVGTGVMIGGVGTVVGFGAVEVLGDKVGEFVGFSMRAEEVGVGELLTRGNSDALLVAH